MDALNLGCLFSDAAPEEFLCQISQEVMRDPVVLPSGETYEKASIIRAGLRDPQTREQLTENQLTSNRALRRQIEKFLTKSVDEYITQNIQGDSEIIATWQSIQVLLENLGNDTSEPALFAHKRVFSLLKDASSTLTCGFLDIEESTQQKVLSALMQVPSSLAKEGLYALLVQFNSRPCTSQRSKRPRRPIPSRRGQSPPSFVVNSAIEAAEKIGLNGLFASHDKSELQLACDFAVLFIQQPFQCNVLNYLEDGDGGEQRAVMALKRILKSEKVGRLCLAKNLDEESLVLKHALQEMVTTLSVWCANSTAEKAARSLHESFENVETLMHLLCGPPWPEMEIAEPVFTAISRHGDGDSKGKLCQLLQGPCKTVVEWIIEEIPKQDSGSRHVVDLIVSLSHVGIRLQELWSEDSALISDSKLDEKKITLVRDLLTELTKDLRVSDNKVSDLTQVYLRLFVVLVESSELRSLTGTPSSNGVLAAECVHTINSRLHLRFCENTCELYAACMQLAREAKDWGTSKCPMPAASPNVCSCVRQSLALARDIALQNGESHASDEEVLELVQELLKQSPGKEDNSVAALCIVRSIPWEKITSDTEQQLALQRNVLELAQIELSLQPPYQGGLRLPDSSTTGSARQPQISSEHLQMLNSLLVCGMQQPILNVLQHLFESETEASKLLSPLRNSTATSAAAAFVDQIMTWVRNSTSSDYVARALLLLQQFAENHTLRPILASHSNVIPVLFVALCSDPATDTSAVLMVMRVYNSLLGEKTDTRSSTLPSKIYRSGVIKLLFQAMATVPESLPLHENGINVAFKLTSRCKDVEYSPSQIEMLLNAAAKWKDVSQVLAHVFGILMYLSTRKLYKQRLCKLDCVNLVLAAISQPKVDMKVLRSGCGVLRNAARNIMERESGVGGFPWNQMAQVTVGLMHKYSDDAEIQYRGCGVLVNIASSQHGMEAAKEVLNCAIIVKASRTHRTHSELQLWALHFYIQYEQESHSQYGKNGVLSSDVGGEVASIMTDYSGNVELQLLGLNVASKILGQYTQLSPSQSERELGEQAWPKSVFLATFKCLSEHMTEDDICVNSLKVMKDYTSCCPSLVKQWMRPQENVLPVFERAKAYVNSHQIFEATESADACCSFVRSIRSGKGS